MENLISLQEAQARLNVGRTTMFRLIQKGEIPVVKVRKLNRFREEDIAAYITSRTRPAQVG